MISTILGNGAWGCAVAAVLAKRGHAVTLWGHDAESLADCARHHENRRYLPGVKLPSNITYQHQLSAAVEGAKLVLVAVPTRHLRSALKGLSLASNGGLTANRTTADVRAGTHPPLTVISLTKGIEPETLCFPSEIIAEVTRYPGTVGVLSGPTMAMEVAQGKPASITFAHPDEALTEWVQAQIATPTFRVYISVDRIGVELAGAVKNVIALAAGIAEGMGLGDNAKAALLTRGLTELRRLGRALGANDETFMGLAGVGDLYTTCASPLGRNRGYGELIGKGMTADEARDAMGGKAVEGFDTAVSIHALGAKHGVELPISEAVWQVLHHGVTPRRALEMLLARDLRAEEDV